jgi:hypothetical protein
MNQPIQTANPVLPKVPFYLVVAPGVDPQSVEVEPAVVKLTWNFGQMDRGELIDLAKEVDEHLKALEKWVEGARGVLKQTLPAPAEPGTETITRGHRFEAHYIKSMRSDVDREKVKAYFGPKYPEYCKSTGILTLKIVPIPMTPGAAG